MRPIDVRRALELISLAPSGDALVRAYRRLENEGRAAILELDEQRALELAPTLSGSRQTRYGRPAGGFVFDGAVRTIYLQKDEDFRIQAPLLVHELVHCMDESYIASRATELTLYARLKETATRAMQEAAGSFRDPGELTIGDLSEARRAELLASRREALRFSDRRIYAAERAAYRGLHDWVTEICSRLPEYRGFLASLRAQGYVFDRLVTDEEIVRIYGIDPQNL